MHGVQKIGVRLEQRALARNAAPRKLAQLEYRLFRLKSLLQKPTPPFRSRNDSARFCAAKRLLDLGRPKAASIILERLATSKSASPEMHLALGFLLLRAQDFHTAQKQFELALSHNPRLKLAHIGIAHCHAHTGDRTLWLQSLERLHPMMIAVHTLSLEEQLELGHALTTAHEYLSAIQILLQTTSQYPDEVRGWSDLAALYRNTGQYHRALETLEKASQATSSSTHLQWLKNLLKGELAVYAEGKRPQLPRQNHYLPKSGSILHVLESSLPEQTSGYTYRSHHILRSLSQMGYEVRAITRPGFGSHTNKNQQADVQGISYHRLSSNGHSNYRWNPLDAYLQQYSEGVSELSTDCSPMLIHAHSNFKNGFAALAVARALQIPFVYELRGLWEDTQVAVGAIDEESDRYRYFKEMENECLSQADAVITLSETLKKDLISRSIDPDKIWIVPNGVNLEQFPLLERNRELATSLGISDETVLGYIGSLTHYEGLELLLEAFQEILEQCPKTKLLIIGSGPMESRLQELRKNLQMEEQVILPGRIPQDEVAQYTTLIDIVVLPRLPSRVCNIVSPLKPVEAMATGKALLMSDLPVLKELSSNGALAKHFIAGCAESLAFESIQLIKDSQLRNEIGSHAKKHVREYCSWKDVCQTYREVYSSLLSPEAKQYENRI
ncbi:MAG: glycosyltransferase [Bdellovibrionales bacterium]|nr:glycosyltransferase [Bdellovibrionales bacterium]